MEIPSGSYGFIYITTNKVNGKKYLGQKKIDVDGRWKTYLGSGKAFKCAVAKYGRDNFTREVIHIGYSAEELNRLEERYTREMDCVNDRTFYNLVHGGGTVSGLKFSEETIQVLRERMLGEKNYFYGKSYAGELNPFYGKTHSPETRKRMSDSHKGQVAWNKGKVGVYSPETLQKMRLAKLGKPQSEAHKAAVRKAQSGENHPMFGKHHSEESKQKIREKALGRRPSEETKRKMSVGQKKRYVDKPKDATYLHKPVICTTTGEIFESVKSATESCGLKNSISVVRACQGKNKTAGKLPDGTRLQWEYYEKSIPR